MIRMIMICTGPLIIEVFHLIGDMIHGITTPIMYPGIGLIGILIEVGVFTQVIIQVLGEVIMATEAVISDIPAVIMEPMIRTGDTTPVVILEGMPRLSRKTGVILAIDVV